MHCIVPEYDSNSMLNRTVERHHLSIRIFPSAPATRLAAARSAAVARTRDEGEIVMNWKHLALPVMVAMSAAALSAPAAARMELYKDYEPAQQVVEMTTVKVDQGQFETYLEGLKSTWIGSNEVAKKLGMISDYHIYANQAPTDGSFDLVLEVVYPSVKTWAGDKAQYMKFLDAYGKANIDKGNETVLKLYNKIRKITGTYVMREVIVH